MSSQIVFPFSNDDRMQQQSWISWSFAETNTSAAVKYAIAIVECNARDLKTEQWYSLDDQRFFDGIDFPQALKKQPVVLRRSTCFITANVQSGTALREVISYKAIYNAIPNYNIEFMHKIK